MSIIYSWNAVRQWNIPHQSVPRQRIPRWSTQGLLRDQSFSSECGEKRRDMRQHPEKGLEAGSRHQAYIIGWSTRRITRITRSY